MSYIIIPSSVNYFGGGCYPNIIVEKEHRSLASANGILYDKITRKLLNIPENVAEGDITVHGTISSIGSRVIQSFTHINCITIEEGVKSIERSAFWGCEIDTLVIPESIKQIGEEAFGYCTIKKLHIFIKNLDEVEIAPKAFDLSQKNKCKLFVPGISISKYKLNRHFRGFAEVLPIPGTEKDVAFSYLKISDDGETILKVDEDASGRFEIPFGIKTVGAYAFSRNRKITEVVLPASVKAIEDFAFSFCSDLERVYMSDSLKWIGKGAFNACNKLKIDRIPTSVEIINERAFYGCLIEGQIHKNIHCIEPQAFSRDIKIDSDNQHYIYKKGCLLSKDGTTLYCVINPNTISAHSTPDNLKKVAYKAYYQCHFHTITVNDSVDTIEDLAFGETYMLHSLHIGSGIRTIGSEILKSSEVYDLYLHVNNINDVQIAKNAFHSFDMSKCYLYVNGKVINDYAKHPLFKCFKELRPIPGTEVIEIDEIGLSAILDCFVYPFGRRKYRFSDMKNIPFHQLIQEVSTHKVSETWDDQVWSLNIDENYRILGMRVLSLHFYDKSHNNGICIYSMQLELRHNGVLYSEKQIEAFLKHISDKLAISGMSLHVYRTKLTREIKANACYDGVDYFIENKEKGKITITIKDEKSRYFRG